LRENYDDEWWEKDVPLKVRKNSEERKSKEPSSSFSLIYYTEFSDLKKIIMKNENCFIKKSRK